MDENKRLKEKNTKILVGVCFFNLIIALIFIFGSYYISEFRTPAIIIISIMNMVWLYAYMSAILDNYNLTRK